MIKNLRLILLIFFISNCGFKIVNNENLYNFSVTDINISGDPDNNAMLVSVIFNLINSPEPNTLELEIERVR